MKSYYYNIEDAEFMTSDGEKIPRCIPELCYQERARWKIFLRDRNNGVHDLSGVISWSAAADCDFRSETPPMCRTLSGDIAADPADGSVTVALDAATTGFLAAVNGRRSREAEFELCGFDADGDRTLYLAFPILARMTVDPDPEATAETPETLATKSFVSSLITASAASVLSGVVTEAFVSGGYATSAAAANVASQLIASGGYAKCMVEVVSSGAVAYISLLSGGTQYRFTQPLTALSIGSVADVPEPDGIVFSAGAVVTPPTCVTVFGTDWQNVSGHISQEDYGEPPLPPYEFFTLSEADNWYAYVECAEIFFDEFSGDGEITCDCRMDAQLISSGGSYAISCHVHNYRDTTRTEWEWNDELEEDVETTVTTDVVEEDRDGIFATSPDLIHWTVVDPSCMMWTARTINWDPEHTDIHRFTGFAFSAGGAGASPCEIALPASLRLLGSDTVTVSSGGVYAMEFRNAMLRMDEVKPQTVEAAAEEEE